MRILDNLTSGEQPAFASNCNGRIVDWNQGAERLLGYSAATMIGRHCFEVLDGKDVFGNRFCHERCAIRCMIRRHEPVHHWQLNYRTASSARIDVSVGAVVVNGDESTDSLIVHLLQPVDSRGKEFEPAIPLRPSAQSRHGEVTDADSRPVRLTGREHEILRLLAAGSSTSEIVQQLNINANTVRTHIRSILYKLDAHSRLEAVSKALRRRLL